MMVQIIVPIFHLDRAFNLEKICMLAIVILITQYLREHTYS
jgi:hypothetical protein